MQPSYWAGRIFDERISRRRALVGAAGLTSAAAAMTLVGCGSSKENNGAKGSSLISAPVDTTKQATAGGIWPFFSTVEALSFDHLNTARAGSSQAEFLYSRFFKLKVGTPDKPPIGEIEGDAVESWELAPDGSQITMKLRPNLKLDPRAPTNGRAVDAKDVLFSMEKFSRLGAQRGDYFSSLSPDAPITSITAPDNSTIVLKLGFPYAPLYSLLGFSRGPIIQPVEADGKFDPRTDTRGSGPWILDKAVPSSRYEFRKNPNWYGVSQGRPLLDGIDRLIMPEYATRLAQFKAGALWTADVRPDDILTLKHEDNRIQVQKANYVVAVRMIAFSQRDGSPFLDERVRRALSMLIDRELWIDALYNISDFEKEGVSLGKRWNSPYSGGWNQYWVDPKGKDLGEGAQYFQHNPTEAKKLLKAAGAENLQTVYEFFTGDVQREYETIMEMWREGGIKVDLNPLDNVRCINRCHQAVGNIDGVCSGTDGPGADIDVTFSTRVRAGGSSYSFFPKPLPKIDDLIKLQRRELDVQKRTKLIKDDLQREIASQMPYINFPGQAEPLNMYWPWLGNFGWVRGMDSGGFPASEVYPHYWFDQSKKNA